MDTTPMADDAPISLKSAKLAMALEKTVLPWIYAFLAYQRFSAALGDYKRLKVVAHFPALYPDMLGLHYANLTRDVLLFFLIALYGAMLLFSRPATVLPTSRKHILVPIAMSYYFALYGVLDYLPFSLRQNLLPGPWQFPCSMAGVVLGVIGYSIAMWAIFYLRRSFAIFVSVRKIVSKGPYAYIRHPMYLGYLLDSFGVALAGCSIAMLLLGCGFVWLLVERARMEEEKLCEASPSYRQYARGAGFLFPRFRKAAPPS